MIDSTENPCNAQNHRTRIQENIGDGYLNQTINLAKPLCIPNPVWIPLNIR